MQKWQQQQKTVCRFCLGLLLSQYWPTSPCMIIRQAVAMISALISHIIPGVNLKELHRFWGSMDFGLGYWDLDLGFYSFLSYLQRCDDLQLTWWLAAKLDKAGWLCQLKTFSKSFPEKSSSDVTGQLNTLKEKSEVILIQ